jgi:hypothetical protein
MLDELHIMGKTQARESQRFVEGVTILMKGDRNFTKVSGFEQNQKGK